jgi:YjjI family glycine radical enzyme
VRLNLKKVAENSEDVTDFIENQLPYYSGLMFELIESRTAFLHEKSGFFDSFLVAEKLLSEDCFAPMWGVYGMAEAVNSLSGDEKSSTCYGHSDGQNELGHRISKTLSDIVKSTPVTYGLENRALLHSQAGLSSDEDVTPGTRIQYGNEPGAVEHVRALAAHHQYYPSGISDILTIDETVKANPEAMYQLCKGALSLGMREFTANVASNDLVRVTGYMIKLSDIKAFRDSGSRKNTTVLGAEAADKTKILERRPRIISRELEAGSR